jgi:[NiFe] hydrogenase diaphorase moiety large subunit
LLRDLVDKVRAGRAGDYDLQEMQAIGGLMRDTSHCGLGTTAANHVLDTLQKFPEIYRQHLGGSDYGPAFDLDAALEEARTITGRDDAAAHLKVEP